MEIEERLIGCPFCGNRDLSVRDVGRRRTRSTVVAVVCAVCNTEGPTAITSVTAVGRWNTRAQEGSNEED